MAKPVAKQLNVVGTGGLDSGPVKVKWIRIVENPAPPASPPPASPVQRVYFQALEPGATIPMNGHFLLNKHPAWVPFLVNSMADPSTPPTIMVEFKTDPMLPTITFQENDIFLSSVVTVFPTPGTGPTSVHGEVIAMSPIP